MIAGEDRLGQVLRDLLLVLVQQRVARRSHALIHEGLPAQVLSLLVTEPLQHCGDERRDVQEVVPLQPLVAERHVVVESRALGPELVNCAVQPGQRWPFEVLQLFREPLDLRSLARPVLGHVLLLLLFDLR